MTFVLRIYHYPSYSINIFLQNNFCNLRVPYNGRITLIRFLDVTKLLQILNKNVTKENSIELYYCQEKIDFRFVKIIEKSKDKDQLPWTFQCKIVKILLKCLLWKIYS